MSFDLTILKAYKNLLVFLAFVKITNVQLKVQGTSIWSHSFYEIRAGEVRKTFAVSNREASPGCSSILAFNRPYSGVDLWRSKISYTGNRCRIVSLSLYNVSENTACFTTIWFTLDFSRLPAVFQPYEPRRKIYGQRETPTLRSLLFVKQVCCRGGRDTKEKANIKRVKSHRYPRTPGRATLHFTQSGKTILIFKSGYENKMADNVHRNPVFVKALFVSDIKSIFI